MQATSIQNTMNSPVRFTKKRKEPTSPVREQKKSVSFLPNVLVYRTMHINDFTDEEVDNTWYNADEMSAIVNDCVTIISSLDEQEQRAKSTQCIRGLEFRTQKGQKRRAQHRFCAFDAVLGEQEAQWDYGEYDDNKIRIRYTVYSKPSRAEALRTGLEDAKEAMNIYREGETCSLILPSTKTTPSVFTAFQGMKVHRKFPVNPQTPVKGVRTLSLRQYHSPVERAR